MATTFNKLSEKLYTVKVPMLALISEEELDIWGAPLKIMDKTETARYDMNDLSVVALPINRIAEIYSMGYPIWLVNGEGLNELYNSIEEYLSTINHKPVDMLNAPIHTIANETIANLDNLAGEIFRNNRHEIVKDKFAPSKAWDLGIKTVEPIDRYNNNSNTTGLHYATPDSGSTTSNVLGGYSGMSNINNNLYNVPATNVERTASAYIHNNVPTIDPNKVERKTTYRSTFKL